MNVEWAITQLEAFQAGLRSYRDGNSSHRENLVAQEVAVKAVLDRLGIPLYRTDVGLGNGGNRYFALDNVTRGIALLRQREEIEANIGPSGPRIVADKLHPVIWNAAAHLWDDGHHGPAVQRAATFLSAHVKDLLGRNDVQDVPLMQQAFSEKAPEDGKPRLRWPGDPTDLTVKSMNDGLRQLAPGVFMTIRNPATHKVEDMPEYEAVEQLAALSLLARWIDQCTVITSA